MDVFPPSGEAIRREIAREIVAAQENSHGTSVSNVEVALHATFVAVTMNVELTEVEERLVAAGHAASVKAGRELLQTAGASTNSAIVERATGRRVIGVSGRTMLGGGSPWTMEVFRLAEAPA